MIVWVEEKDKTLKLERGISFEEISERILNKEYLDILQHPTRRNQKVFVMELSEYVYAAPCVIDEDHNIVLKTAYPSRKLLKKYIGDKK